MLRNCNGRTNGRTTATIRVYCKRSAGGSDNTAINNQFTGSHFNAGFSGDFSIINRQLTDLRVINTKFAPINYAAVDSNSCRSIFRNTSIFISVTCNTINDCTAIHSKGRINSCDNNAPCIAFNCSTIDSDTSVIINPNAVAIGGIWSCVCSYRGNYLTISTFRAIFNFYSTVKIQNGSLTGNSKAIQIKCNLSPDFRHIGQRYIISQLNNAICISRRQCSSGFLRHRHDGQHYSHHKQGQRYAYYFFHVNLSFVFCFLPAGGVVFVCKHENAPWGFGHTHFSTILSAVPVPLR